MRQITRVLEAIEAGDARAARELLPLVYEELRRLAAAKLRHEKPGQTLQPTALVHEAYLRLVGREDPGWQGREHFFAAAAEAMRRILIDSARRKRRMRHGGGQHRLDIDAIELPVEPPSEDLVALDEALTRLAEEDPRKAKLVTLRYFAGFSIDEAARVLGVSHATAERDWSYARAWLYAAMHGG